MYTTLYKVKVCQRTISRYGSNMSTCTTFKLTLNNTVLKCGKFASAILTQPTRKSNNKSVTLSALMHTRAPGTDFICLSQDYGQRRLLSQNFCRSFTCLNGVSQYIQSDPASLILHNSCALNVTRFYSYSSSHGSRFKSRNVFKKKTEKNYYDILGITPKATQAQVKTAYYKLSKLHHPDIHHSTKDKTQVAENQEKFNEVSEAYRVLGNTLLRRKYDRGILSPRDTAESVKKQEYADIRDNKVYRPATEKKIYDFDEFYSKHYGESISRERQARVDRMKMEAKYHQEMTERNTNLMFPVVVFIIIGIVYNVYKYFSDNNQFNKIVNPTQLRENDIPVNKR